TEGDLVDASVTDDRDRVMRHGSAEDLAEDASEEDADRGAGPGQRDEGDRAGTEDGEAAGEGEQVPGEAGFLTADGVVKDAEVERGGEFLGGDHFAVVTLAGLDEALLLRDGRRLEADALEEEGDVIRVVTAAEHARISRRAGGVSARLKRKGGGHARRSPLISRVSCEPRGNSAKSHRSRNGASLRLSPTPTVSTGSPARCCSRT